MKPDDIYEGSEEFLKMVQFIIDFSDCADISKRGGQQLDLLIIDTLYKVCTLFLTFFECI